MIASRAAESLLGGGNSGRKAENRAELIRFDAAGVATRAAADRHIHPEASEVHQRVDSSRSHTAA
jgi:hypothetical protein